MASATYTGNDAAQRALLADEFPPAVMASQSAVSWAAVVAGAATAAALSLILLILGTGLGLSSVSPWAQAGVSAATFGVSTVLWLTFTQVAASGLGGYIAGRLRTRWTAVHTDEVYFRDTAHGFLAWAVASLATAALLGSVVGSIVGGGVQAGAAVAGGAASAATAAAAKGVTAEGANDGMAYFMDSLYRKDMGTATPAAAGSSVAAMPGAMDAGAASAAESTRIFMNSLRTGPLPAEDLRYVAQMVAQRTGLSQADAEKRVGDTYTRMQTKMREAEVAAREAADKARKASAYAALWLFVTLLIGAFVASYCATMGGRQRDAL